MSALNEDIPTEIIPRLWLGSRHVRESNPSFMSQITHLVDASNLSTLPAPMCKHVYIVPVTDSKDSLLCSHFERVSLLIKSAIDNDNDAAGSINNVLVHCNQGISRSASLVIAYLIMENGFTLREAFRLVKKLRPSVLPNSGFLSQLIELHVLKCNTSHCLGDTFCMTAALAASCKGL